MKKLVLKIDMPDDGAKRKALKIVAAFPGIDSISVDMKARKMTIIGTVDPTKVVSRLRKYWRTELLTVGPAKEPEKKEEPKKEEAKKEGGGGGGDKKPAADEAKKEGGDQEKKPAEAKKEGESGEGKKEGDAKTNMEAAAAAGGGEKKEEEKKVDPVLEMVRAYRAYNPHMTKYYYAHSMEENPNACVIC